MSEENPFNVDLRTNGRRRMITDPSDEAFRIDRLPPHSDEAEKAVLGCIMLDAQAINTCTELISDPDAFYDLRHRTIYEAMLGMSALGEPIDTITLLQWLEGEVENVGGISFIASLPDLVPSAANIGYYTKIVWEKFMLRRMVTVCTDVVGKIYDYTGEVEPLIDNIESEVLRVRNASRIEEGSGIKDLVGRAIRELERAANKETTGLKTGFTELDRLTGGLQPGEMIIIAARPSMGKAQPLDAKVMTPCGFVNIGSLKPGDTIIGCDGLFHSVTGVYPQGVKDVFKVELSDGSYARCCGEHLWLTQTRNERRRVSGSAWSVKTTSMIADTIRRPDGGHRNHIIPTCDPIQFYEAKLSEPRLSLDPWLLGALIGDGTLGNSNIQFSKPEQDVQMRLINALPEEDTWSFADKEEMTIRIRRKKRNNASSRTKMAIREMGLDVNSSLKFIPGEFMLSSPKNRLELIRGILDTDGYTLGHAVEYTTSSSQLADDVTDLVRGLGGICSRATERTPRYSYNGKLIEGLTSYRMNIWFNNGIIPVSSKKHLKKFKLNARNTHRSIVSISKDGREECVCISTDAPNGLYLTDDYIVTHNTSLAMNIAEYAAIDLSLSVGVFSLEMTSVALVKRILCSRSRVNSRAARDGFLKDRDYPKLTATSVKLVATKLHIDDTGSMTIMQLRAKARRMAQKHDIKLLVIDYLQLIHGTSRQSQGSRVSEITEVSNGIKSLAKELNIPVLVLSQLNRDIDKDGKRRPRLSDLRDSGALEQDADLVSFLYRKVEEDEDPYEEALSVKLCIAKQRNGPIGEVPLVFMKQYTRFESEAKISQADVPVQKEFDEQGNRI